MIRRWVHLANRWRWPITAAWIVAVLAAAVFSRPLPDLLSGGGWFVPGSQSAGVEEALDEGFVGRGPTDVTLVVHDSRYTSVDAEFEQRFDEVVAAVRDDPRLDAQSSVGWSTLGPDARAGYLGEDGRTALEVFGLGLPDGIARQVLPTIQEDLSGTFGDSGLDVSLVGTASFWGEVNHLSEQGLVRAELITLPLIVLVLVLLFGGVVAALASLSVGITSILFSFVVMTILARQRELSVFVENTATMLGLGVGVDYSLFVIARFKEELKAGRSVDEALEQTLRTSGETVVVSGLTIVAAMSTLFVVPLGSIQSIALGAITVVAFSILTTVLLLPVLLRLLGHRIERGVIARASGRHRRPGSARWEVLATRIMRRPVVFLVGGLTVMLGLAVPALGLTTFTPDAQIISSSSPVRAGYDLMQQQFGVGATAPIQVVVTSDGPLRTPEQAAAVSDLADELAGLDGVRRVDSAIGALSTVAPADPFAVLDPLARGQLPPDVARIVGHYVSEDATALVLDVVPAGAAADTATQALLEAVRGVASAVQTAGLSIETGGETAQGVESNEVIQDRLPYVLLAMLVVIYLVLLLTFRSLLLPLKAIAMNLLSVAATFGVLVVVFQHGVGSSLLGFDGTGYIQNFVPVLLITLLFSLSTDYEVFLLSRVREDFLVTGDNEGSVARGLAHTAPLISGAATLMVVVFGAFAFAGILPIKQLGLGMAVAIALDATIVRLVLVPASMRLMGGLNWWLPGRAFEAGAGSQREAVNV